jgi:hypothetical protein
MVISMKTDKRLRKRKPRLTTESIQGADTVHIANSSATAIFVSRPVGL